MNQFEFSDLNKFYVSIGVFLITSALFLPWLFLREDLGLLIKCSELIEYTHTTQKILRDKQTIASVLTKAIPVMSSAMILAGSFLIYKGNRGWKKIQAIIEQREELQNTKLTKEIEALRSKPDAIEATSEEISLENKTIEGRFKIVKAESENTELPIPVPLNNSWILNHWGSDCAKISNGKMIFQGKTRLDSDGSHVNLSNILTVGRSYIISCFAKATPGTTGKFQLWCHDNIGTTPHGSGNAIPYATPSIEGQKCNLRFEATQNPNLRIHLQYQSGEGQIEISDISIAAIKMI